MKLYKKYISHVPSETSDNSFYFIFTETKGKYLVLQKGCWKGNVGKCCQKGHGKAQFDGHFTNQSLRRSCATNLYDNGVPEQVIQETTGHRSVEGVRAY